MALTLIFFYPLAFTDHILARGDTYAYHYPYWAARNAAILNGHLPLWTPDLFMGVPLLANPQIGTFYPPNWLVAPLSPPEGLRVSVLLHVAWTAIGTYALARRTLTVSRPAALAGAAIFAFGGYFGAHIEQINQLQGLAWLPWLLLIFDWTIRNPAVVGTRHVSSSTSENQGRGMPRPYEKPVRASGVLLLGVAIALQFFTGHTQTVFMSLVALGLYALLTRPIRGLIVLAVSGILALILSLPQLLPTLQLMELSNRRGGFNLNQATAFSFSPFIFGRGLLPSYDGLIFSEYIAYIGVIGFALALFGIKKNSTTENTENTEKKSKFLSSVLSVFSVVNPFFVLAVVGVFLALGAFNPLYWLLAGLPGFNLFRVPARWLALFALGSALLAARGLQRLLDGERPSRRLLLATLLLIGGLALSTALTGRLDDGTPAPPPTLMSIVGWIVAGVAFVALSLTPQPPLRTARERQESADKPLSPGRGVWGEASPSVLSPQSYLLLFALLLELFLAGRVLPAQNLVPPETFEQQRFTVSQLLALNEGQNPPGRVLSISDGLFDPGDRAALETRWFDLSPEALQTAFVTVKQRELLAPNLPLLYGIPSVDGFDGGLLPTSYYTAFTSLMIPDGELRTIDGRLREVLASEACRGACMTDHRWLNLTNTRWLVLDKVYDLVHDGIFYDMGLSIPWQGVPFEGGNQFPSPSTFATGDFEANQIRVVVRCQVYGCLDHPPVPPIHAIINIPNQYIEPASIVRLDEQTQIVYFNLEAAQTIPFGFVEIDRRISLAIDAVTLVDTRTGDFQQLAPEGWRRVLSSDVKIYENTAVYPRAYMLYDAEWTPDTDEGTETALDLMRAPDFDPSQTTTLAGLGADPNLDPVPNTVTITEYTADRVVIDVETDFEGYLFLSDAYYPGWRATIDGAPTTIYRADIMFRAVFVPAGAHEIVYTYDPFAQ
ncbi:MAG: YfhO family protein [Chloroflexi bacterium]|nr:YfhO family protein [Chloroflexota bacterium]